MSQVLVRMTQRGAKRAALRMNCRVVRASTDELVGDIAVDLSEAGMLVLSEADVIRGDDLRVSFYATEFGIRFDTAATVARVVQGRRPTDRGRALGLRFRTLTAVQRHILRGHLRKIPPPLPKRERRVDYAKTIERILFGA